MFCHRTARNSSIQLWSLTHTRRTIFSSTPLYRSALRDPRFSAFLEGPGSTFKNPKPRNWLGNEVPFPMNPSFLPPIPISDDLRTKLYMQYMADPLKNTVRDLARKYHLSIKRVDAILRLKGQENAWIKKKPIQTGFLVGMEEILGVKENQERRQGISDVQPDPVRHDVDEADALEEEEKRDRARQKYQRMFWEAIPEGEQEPIIPGLLEEAKNIKRQTAKTGKSHPSTAPSHKGTQNKGVVVVKRPGRPKMTFIDIGNQLVNFKEQSKRILESQRRRRIRVQSAANRKS